MIKPSKKKKGDEKNPEINPEIWKCTSDVFHSKDEKHQYSFSFQTFEKK